MRNRDRYKRIIPVFFSLCLLFVPCLCAREQEPSIDRHSETGNQISGKFEIGIHYGPWTLKPISGIFEEDLYDKIGDKIGDMIIDNLGGQLQEAALEKDLQLGTSGSNFGLEIRYYPNGKMGSFSLGFSLERTRIRIRADGNVRQVYADGTFSDVEASGFITTNPLTTNLSFRWDTNPGWRISPYFVIGFGLAAFVGDAGYEYVGSYTSAGPTQEISETEEKSIREWEEEIDFNLPNIFYLFQLQLGLRARIMPNVSLNFEAGVWDGLVFRIGAFYRF